MLLFCHCTVLFVKLKVESILIKTLHWQCSFIYTNNSKEGGMMYQIVFFSQNHYSVHSPFQDHRYFLLTLFNVITYVQYTFFVCQQDTQKNPSCAVFLNIDNINTDDIFCINKLLQKCYKTKISQRRVKSPFVFQSSWLFPWSDDVPLKSERFSHTIVTVCFDTPIESGHTCCI